MRRRFPTGLPLAALMGLVVAFVIFAASLWGALRLDPPPQVERTRSGADLVLAASSGESTISGDSTSDVELASDPFRPDRRLPDEAADATTAPRDTTRPSAAATVRLLGTVVRGGSGFALCQLATDVPRMVHVGEKLGDLTLISLEQGRATFRSADGTRLELSLSHPGT